MRSIAASDDGSHGLAEARVVTPERPVFDVIEIELHRFLPINLRSSLTCQRPVISWQASSRRRAASEYNASPAATCGRGLRRTVGSTHHIRDPHIVAHRPLDSAEAEPHCLSSADDDENYEQVAHPKTGGVIVSASVGVGVRCGGRSLASLLTIRQARS